MYLIEGGDLSLPRVRKTIMASQFERYTIKELNNFVADMSWAW